MFKSITTKWWDKPRFASQAVAKKPYLSLNQRDDRLRVSYEDHFYVKILFSTLMQFGPLSDKMIFTRCCS